MGFDIIAIVLQVLAVGAALGFYLIKDAKQRQYCAVIFLTACTVLVGWSFYPQLKNRDKDTKSLAIMDSSTAEFVMKLSSSLDDIFREAGGGGLAGSASGAGSGSKNMMSEMHEQALKSARLAVKHDPDSVAMKFRELIISGESKLPLAETLKSLKQMSDANAAPAAQLIERIYETHALPKADEKEALALCEKLTSRGWLRDVATIEVYRSTGEKSTYTRLFDQYHDSLIAYAWRFVALICSAVKIGRASCRERV